MLRLGIMLLSIFLKVIAGGTNLDLSMQMAYKDEILELGRNHSRTEYTIVTKKGTIESKVTFYLYTRAQTAAEVLNIRDATMWEKSKFRKDRPTKFVIHGYFGGVHKPMIQNIKDRFLEMEDVNVIAVDWGKIAVDIDYLAVARSTIRVGRYLAELLDFLVSQGCVLDDFHLIGHSLGAHVAGFAGTMSKSGKPARITGLDPAKPAFSTAGPSERLDSDDAKFVDCIHTCGGLLGIHIPICGADLYVNGGKHAQPGCLQLDFGKCSHVRSHEYFAESIHPDHVFPTLECPSLTEDPTECIESHHIMGNYLKSSARGIFYVLTNTKYPFAPKNNQILRATEVEEEDIYAP